MSFPIGHSGGVFPQHSSRQVASDNSSKPLLNDVNGFDFIRSNPRPAKPRKVGVTEVRGPYYSAYSGSFSPMLEASLREMIDLAHQHGVYVSTGGWMKHVLTQSNPIEAVDKYISKIKDLGFDVLECSTGFLSIPSEDFIRLIDRVQSAGLKAKPELGIQFGAGGDTAAEDLESTGTSDPSKVINLAKRCVNELGVERIMIESEGITENVKSWRTDVIQAITRDAPSGNIMLEAADPSVFNWYIREFGNSVNLFVDHSQIVQLSCLRSGIWGMADTFGKIVSYPKPI